MNRVSESQRTIKQITMGYISVDQLKQGMVLAEEVRDTNGRLLLPKGGEIQPKHLRMLKMWGIGEANITGDHDSDTNPDSSQDPKLIEQVASIIKKLFKYNDLSNPLIQEIFKLAVIRRCKDAPSVPMDQGKIDENTLPEKIPVVDIRAAIRKKNFKLPEMPSIVGELNEVTADPFSSSDDIALIVNKSPSLAALILKIVNSAFYGFPSKIDSISRAVSLIGTKEISALGMGLSAIKLFKDIPKDIVDLKSFFKHSLACGVVARLLAAHLSIQYTEQLFVAGLLHDVGRVIIFKDFPIQAKALLCSIQKSDKLLYDAETGYLGCRHTHIGKELFNKWKLPYSLEDSTYYHHKPSKAPDITKPSIVHLADVCVHGLGLGSSGERYVPVLDMPACTGLNITPGVIKNVLNQALHQLKFIETVFQDQ